MLFSDVCRDYLHSMQHERGLTARTVKTYGACLGKFRHWFESEGIQNPTLDEVVTLPLLRRYLYTMSGQKQRPRTIRNSFVPIKCLAEFGIENGLLKENPVRSLKLPKKDASSRPQVSSEELQALVEAVERQHDAERTALSRAMVYVLVFCGLRFQEMLDLRLQDLNLDNKTLLVAQGKGKKSRLLYPPSECITALKQWVHIREKMRPHHEWLWAYDIGRRMGEVGFRQMLEEIKAIAGLKDHKNIQPHAIRHAFATRLMQNGADIKAIQASLGHSQAATTFVYLHMNEQPAKAMQELSGFKPESSEIASRNTKQGSSMSRRRVSKTR